MDSVLKADIFFFITTVAVVFLSLLFAVALIYAVRILRDVKEVSSMMKEQARLVSEDVNRLRQTLREKGDRWSEIISAVTALWGKKKGRKK